MNASHTAARTPSRGLSDGLAAPMSASRPAARDAATARESVPGQTTPPTTAQQAEQAQRAERAEQAEQGLPPMGQPTTPRAFGCRCGRPVFFRNSECLACHTPLGYDSATCRLLPLQLDSSDRMEPVAAQSMAIPRWHAMSGAADAPRFLRCANLDTAAACNWLVADGDSHAGAPPLCRCCRLTRTLPDQSLPSAGVWWNRIELAKRRLVSSLIGLQLPVLSKVEDPLGGLVFDLLRAQPGQPPVVTGHADGVITLDVEEADDTWREQRRVALHEPYRTLLGHLRHECGHYYWQRLVDNGPWLQPFRAAFGDERQDYTAALGRHYSEGAPADWGQRFVSSYASSHPWEDWAETWAHYLHLVDTLDTARSFGLDGESVELTYERFGPDVVTHDDGPQAMEFLRLINDWMELTGVLNELSRSMGEADFYPFVLSLAAARKLHVVHQVIHASRG